VVERHVANVNVEGSTPFTRLLEAPVMPGLGVWGPLFESGDAMSVASSTLQISGLPKGVLNALQSQAKAAGVTAADYAKQLIEEGVSLQQQAQTKTFDELYASTQSCFRESSMSEEELDILVDAARTRHHRRTSNKKR
jgi:hypothetical protein